MRASSLRRSTSLTTAATRAALGLGSWSSSVKIARTCGTVTAGVFPPQPQPLGLQEPQRQKRQRHVVVPADPTAHLVVAPPDLALALLERLLDPVAAAMHPRHLPTPRLPRVGQGVPRRRLLLATSDHRQALARPDVAVLLLGLDRRQQHLDGAGSFVAVLDLDRAPASRRLPRRPLIHALEQRPP